MITPLELTANLAITASIFLAGRNSVHTWWTGIAGCMMFAVLFYQTRLYADVTLQIFFVGTSVLGWWQWLHGSGGQPLAISRVRIPVLGALLLLAGLTTLGYGLLLHRLTDAYAPFLDSAILALSIIAQFLLMRRKLESWGFWLAVNCIAVPLYASRGLYLTSALYAVYWINAVVSLWHWRRLMRQHADINRVLEQQRA